MFNLKCPRCGLHILEEQESKYFIVRSCDNCLFLEYEWHKCCRSPDIERVLYTQRNDRVVIREQCMNCGKLLGTPAISFSKVDSDSLRFYNESLAAKREAELKQLKEDRQFILPNYTRYFHSREWNKKREEILKRDNHLCQVCKKGAAEQVHHLTYERMGRELSEDLLSVCTNCHKKLHDEEKEKLKEINQSYMKAIGKQDRK